jgi:hypothetical protein
VRHDAGPEHAVDEVGGVVLADLETIPGEHATATAISRVANSGICAPFRPQHVVRPRTVPGAGGEGKRKSKTLYLAAGRRSLRRNSSPPNSDQTVAAK